MYMIYHIIYFNCFCLKIVWRLANGNVNILERVAIAGRLTFSKKCAQTLKNILCRCSSEWLASE